MAFQAHDLLSLPNNQNQSFLQLFLTPFRGEWFLEIKVSALGVLIANELSIFLSVN